MLLGKWREQRQYGRTLHSSVENKRGDRYMLGIVNVGFRDSVVRVRNEELGHKRRNEEWMMVSKFLHASVNKIII